MVDGGISRRCRQILGTGRGEEGKNKECKQSFSGKGEDQASSFLDLWLTKKQGQLSSQTAALIVLNKNMYRNKNLSKLVLQSGNKFSSYAMNGFIVAETAHYRKAEILVR